MGVLRVSYTDKVTKFVYKCKKKDVLQQLNQHLNMFRTEKVKSGTTETVRIIPNETVIAEYQDGVDKWVDGGSTETVPVPPTPPMRSGR